MKNNTMTKPKTAFAKAVARALSRAAKRARTVARQYGTSIVPLRGFAGVILFQVFMFG